MDWRRSPTSSRSRSAATIPASRSRPPCAITCARAGSASLDVGTDGPDPVDYPDIAAQVARLVARKEVDAGIVIDGAGIGSAIAANKIDGVRAAMCTDKTLARYAREHNGANVLALGATLSADGRREGDRRYLAGHADGRGRATSRRLAKMRALEQTQ